MPAGRPPPPVKRIGLLGCGAMGTRIAGAVTSGAVPARLVAVYDTSRDAAERLAAAHGDPEIAGNVHLLSSMPLDIIVEAASQEAVRQSALGILQDRRDLLVMSTGALLDDAVRDVLEDACRDYNRRLVLPSGAIAGLDAVRAARDGLESVSITTTKHPRSYRGAAYFAENAADPSSITSRTVLYEGPASEAVRLFPANANVAALLSLAGIGGGRTLARIVADPGADSNTHHIEASGPFGGLDITVRNRPDPQNPGTSLLASLSAIEALGAYCSGGPRPGA